MVVMVVIRFVRFRQWFWILINTQHFMNTHTYIYRITKNWNFSNRLFVDQITDLFHQIRNGQSLNISLGAIFVEKWIIPDGRSIFTVKALLLISKYFSICSAGNWKWREYSKCGWKGERGNLAFSLNCKANANKLLNLLEDIFSTNPMVSFLVKVHEYYNSMCDFGSLAIQSVVSTFTIFSNVCLAASAHFLNSAAFFKFS